jgi:hypothetical protein
VARRARARFVARAQDGSTRRRRPTAPSGSMPWPRRCGSGRSWRRPRRSSPGRSPPSRRCTWPCSTCREGSGPGSAPRPTNGPGGCATCRSWPGTTRRRPGATRRASSPRAWRSPTWAEGSASRCARGSPGPAVRLP